MKQILKFLREVRTEFTNITWPKRDTLIQLTFVVISISLIISLILGGFDYIFTQGINLFGQSGQTQVLPTSVPTTVMTQVPTLKLVSPTPKK